MKSLNTLEQQNLIRLGNYIKSAREEKHISLRGLSALTQISYATISKIENAKAQSINPNTLVRISAVLKLDLVKMLTLAGYFELVFRLRYGKDES